MRKIHNRSERGVAAVELAIVLPTIFLICASAVGLGSAWRTSVRLESIANDAARLCGVRPTALQDGCMNALISINTTSGNCTNLDSTLSTVSDLVDGVTVLGTEVEIRCSYTLLPGVNAVPPIVLRAVSRRAVN